jgi:hypothetical protein
MQRTLVSSEGSLLDTAVHELLHALFFSDALMEDYIDSSGRPLGPDKIVGTDYAGRTVLKSPKAS